MGVSKGVKSGAITPVFCGDALLMRGMEQFMDGLTWLAPSAAEKAGEVGADVDGEPVEISVNRTARRRPSCSRRSRTVLWARFRI